MHKTLSKILKDLIGSSVKGQQQKNIQLRDSEFQGM